jgi:glycerate 2-kinase
VTLGAARTPLEQARGAFLQAVEGFDLGRLVALGLPPRPPARARVRVLAVGKAAKVMAEGALRVWKGRVEAGLVVVPDGTKAELDDVRFDVVRAGHPLPDARSVEAAERARVLAASEAKDLLLVLVSGGASALLCAPIEGVTLDDKVEVTRALLASGAPIRDINTVRRHLSRIKGGGLTRAAWPCRVLALVASDVIEGGVEDVGSGPTAPDSTAEEDARLVLSRWAPELSRLPLGETLKPDDPVARRQRAKVIAQPNDFANAVAEALRNEGYRARTLSPTNDDAAKLAQEYLRLADGLPSRTAWVRAAEPRLAVTTSSPGNGGRATHIAALMGRELPDGLVFLAGASDGVDGSSGLAGAAVDADFRTLGDARIAAAIRAFDTASLHAEAGTGIALGPTGKNFADVHVLLRG